jgi:3-methylfumaryl-CoA hydratase
VYESSDVIIQDEDYSSWVSRSEVVEDEASRSAALKLAALLDRRTSQYVDDEEKLFPLGHWLHFTPTAAQSSLGTDGHPKFGRFIPPLRFAATHVGR